MADYSGKYYTINAEYKLSGYAMDCDWVWINNYYFQLKCREKPVYKLVGIYGRIIDEPSNTTILKYTNMYVRVLKSIHLNNISTTYMVLVIITISITIGLFFICLKGYRRVEITYIPGLSINK